ncbi:MAG: hypothetical protein JXL97_20230, partial [Bacteroidales bacterium]|nr:hypothetical protein [Bacteroidales bacterium]
MRKTFKILTLLSFSMLFFQLTYGQTQTYKYNDSWGNSGLTITESKTTDISFNYSISEFSIIDNTIDGQTMQLVELPGIYLFNDFGKPDLPGSGKFVAIPQGATPTVKIVDARVEIFKDVEVAPAPEIPLDNEEFNRKYIKDDKVYSKNTFYPENPVIISEPRKLRGVDVVMLGITPFQYNPVTKELRVYRDIKVEIAYENGNGVFGDNRLRNKWWEPVLQDALVNYSMLSQIDYSAKNKVDGEYEYLIIVPDDQLFIDYANQLKEFRIKQGISTGIFTTTDIGGNTTTAIEDFIDNAYNTWSTPPIAVLLMADYGTSGSTITSPVYGDGYVGSNYCISDNFYADVDEDMLPDIVFARMTAQNEAHLQTMVSKVLEYETNPPTSADFYNKPVTALGWQTERWFQICSEVVGGFWANELGKSPVRINAVYDGNPSVDPWSNTTYANTTAVLDYFGPNGLGYIPATPQELGGFTGGSATMVTNAINDGCFMFQHRDHGATYGWGEPAYSTSDISNLTNTELPFIWSVNCLTGKFDESSEVFAERFHRYTYNGQNSGALGIIAATESSYSFVNDTYVWGAYDNMWPEFMPDNTPNPESRMILPAFANVAGKNFLEQSSWPSGITEAKPVTYYLFHHHGDAFLNVYSEVPQNLTVSCDDAQVFGNLVYNVNVDVDAFISVTYFDETDQESKILGTAISTGGTTSVNLDYLPNPGTQLLVTITKQNYYRYTKDVIVIVPSGPYLVVNDYENSVDFGQTLDLDIVLENVGVEQATGVLVTATTTDPNASISNANSISYGNIAAGTTTAPSSGAFSLSVDNDLPDGYQVAVNISITDGDTTWTSIKTITVNAPALTIGNLTIDDSALGNGDGILDPGE